LKLWKDLRDLSGVELRLLVWFLLVSRGDWVIIELPKVLEETGMSEKSYTQAIKGLVEKGYLQKKRKGIYRIAPHLLEEVEPLDLSKEIVEPPPPQPQSEPPPQPQPLTFWQKVKKLLLPREIFSYSKCFRW